MKENIGKQSKEAARKITDAMEFNCDQKAKEEQHPSPICHAEERPRDIAAIKFCRARYFAFPKHKDQTDKAYCRLPQPLLGYALYRIRRRILQLVIQKLRASSGGQ